MARRLRLAEVVADRLRGGGMGGVELCWGKGGVRRRPDGLRLATSCCGSPAGRKEGGAWLASGPCQGATSATSCRAAPLPLGRAPSAPPPPRIAPSLGAGPHVWLRHAGVFEHDARIRLAAAVRQRQDLGRTGAWWAGGGCWGRGRQLSRRALGLALGTPALIPASHPETLSRQLLLPASAPRHTQTHLLLDTRTLLPPDTHKHTCSQTHQHTCSKLANSSSWRLQPGVMGGRAKACRI